MAIDPRWTAEEMLAFLSNPASYEYNPDRVDVVQTHISFVAIAPPYVFKVKKPVDFGFLDFSTFEKRLHFCKEEVRLNNRLCPALYKGVDAISRTASGLAFSDSNVVEHAVRMRYLADGYFMNQLALAGKLGEAQLHQVVEALSKFYRAHPSSPEIAQWGRVERIRISTDENFSQVSPFVGQLLSRATFNTLRLHVDRYYDCHGALFQRRRANGKILDCHGDLHLDHVHIGPNGVCIYDCIEFNERFRNIDIANDIAFLAMDLDFHGRRDLSIKFEHLMADMLDDRELPILLPFYKGYRAFVRGKIAALRSGEPEIPEEQRAAAASEAKQYFQLALHYALSNGRPLVLAVMGRVGTGKSTQAKALADALGWECASSDVIRKKHANVPVFHRGTDAERKKLYDAAMTEQTYAKLADAAVQAAEANAGFVIDATFSKRQHRDDMRRRLAERGLPYRFVEISVADEVVRERLAARDSASNVASDARLEDFPALSAGFEAPDALEDANHFVVTSRTEEAETTEAILKRLVRLN